MDELLANLLPAGIRTEDVVAVVSGVAAFLVVLLIWHGLLERDPLGSRVRSLSDRRASLKADLVLPARRRRMQQLGLMHRVVRQLRLARGKQASAYQFRLARAGFRSRDALITYLFFKLALPIAAAGAGVVVFQWIRPFPIADLTAIAISLTCVAVAAYAPDVAVANTTQRRIQRIRLAMPDAYDLMVICAEAGLSLDAAIDRVGKEMAESCAEMADEFALTAIELSFLPDRQRALNGLAERVPLPGARALVNTLMQTERYGTPLAQSLRVLAAELRTERMMRAEEKAARLPAILTVPMVVFILPPLFVVLIGPAALRTIDALSKL